MKTIYQLIWTVIVLVLISSPTFSQGKCKNYHQSNCEAYGFNFKYSGQSKNAVFEKGQTSIFKLVCYEGFEYRISLCADKKLTGIYFRIREDNTNRNILFDSSTDEEGFLEKIFYVEKSKNLLIEVVVPEGDVASESAEYDELFGCVGVLIEYNKRSDTGFEK
ncbi:MAG: hypothetical protein A2W97_10190 [Bacteroidetes bacterium GWE2_40_63]|nr:MAG: hypothetical protein A2W84_19215 [Bacteroidetes bacterium GWC2_40_13]OFX71189.1 MAG: hypothetical protein A2W96_15765 [Bacteroidetes bacterium GWD2_40_43]OFX92328.1 MAG: hypothetical protein A2W97_10190 [Bacteroidetes bacterium GWE2_40_63]OFY22931.1 MAG: hypothetical protein A2W88_04175 [Bacteroidetes bacterium GWF2_40_13]OFZ29979.1 MAG: hypothetical protein A2437_00795 [Bacteroidetes bacterium RIFOXYC2_FULL_40_12]HAZ03330.1 hypothetical protein [Marinilabiliales bacterium]